jgi:hypothetical protein
MHVHEKIALDHLDRMTDSTGLIQHAIYGIPRRESGYTTDDNARALRLCVRLWSQHPDERMLSRLTTYLSFLEHARGIGRGFHNFLSYDRRWLDAEGCGDCQGQAVRALADVLGSNLSDNYRALAGELIDTVLPTLADLRSLRAQAYVVLAWGHLQSAAVTDIEPLASVAWSAAQRLVECYRRAERPGWQWFESRLTYANAVLPHALFVAAEHWPNEDVLGIAKASFAFLDRQTTVTETGQGVRPLSSLLKKGTGSDPVGANAAENGSREVPVPLFQQAVRCEAPEGPFRHKGSDPLSAGAGIFWPIGNEGWYPRGQAKALYDQQPVEAVTMAEAALAAFNLLGDEEYLAAFCRADAWFRGQNSLRESLVDESSGACCDGLMESGVNRNQGAESTLAYLWTELLAFGLLRDTHAPCENTALRGT